MNQILSLGAIHDETKFGDTDATNCLASDNNIMTSKAGAPDVTKMILTFSSCSIRAFKQILLNKYDY